MEAGGGPNLAPAEGQPTIFKSSLNLVRFVHPSEEIRGSVDTKLKGKRIALGITGSIAAVNCVKLARLLIRRGADVYPVMSEAATRIVHPDAVHFACGRAPVLRLTGEAEHVSLCGQVADKVDLLLVAPATANTISKMACGVDDTPVTTFATTAIGTGIPVIVVPAMHGSMYSHPIVKDNVARLRRIGVRFVGPVMEGPRARMAGDEHVAAEIVRALSGEPLREKRVLVVAGGFSAAWDDARTITSRASGETGIELAVEAYERGAQVRLIIAGRASVPSYIETERLDDVGELIARLRRLKADAIIVPAAIPDYAPARVKGKFPSDKVEVTLRLKRVPKVLGLLRKGHKGVLVGFKAESGVSDNVLEERARARMREHRLDLIVANDLGKVKPGKADALLVGKGTRRVQGSRRELASAVLDEVERLLD